MTQNHMSSDNRKTMDNSSLMYWENRWNSDDIPWHHPFVCPFIEHYFHLLKNNVETPRIFVPLCGKSLDLIWLYDSGCDVVGVEASEKAINDFFKGNGIDTICSELPGCGKKVYQSLDGRIKLICSDLFDLDSKSLGKFDCVWDRGSIIAIHPDKQARYVSLMKEVLRDTFRYLLSTIVYDPASFSGHPRNLPVEEISALFGNFAEVTILKNIERNIDRKDEGTITMKWTLEKWREILILLKPENQIN